MSNVSRKDSIISVIISLKYYLTAPWLLQFFLRSPQPSTPTQRLHLDDSKYSHDHPNPFHYHPLSFSRDSWTTRSRHHYHHHHHLVFDSWATTLTAATKDIARSPTFFSAQNHCSARACWQHAAAHHAVVPRQPACPSFGRWHAIHAARVDIHDRICDD